MDFFGLDIGSATIKIAQVKKEGDRFQLLALGKTETPQPGLLSENPQDQQKVAEAIKKLMMDLGVKTNVVVSALPEGKLVTRVVKMPLMSEEELASSLQYEADAFIPFPLEEAVLRHQIIEKDEKAKVCEVFLVAAQKRLVEKYTALLAMAQLQPLALETELLALNRALVPPDSPNAMVVDFGFKSCNFAISRGGKIYLTRSFPVAGETLTKTLAKELGMEVAQAEEYKKAYGLSEEILEGKIRKVLSPLVKSVTNEMKKAIQYFEQEKKETVKRIILSGGSSGLPNVSQDIAAALGVETEIANPFSLLDVNQQVFAEFLDDGPVYAVAIGLAKREIE